MSIPGATELLRKAHGAYLLFGGAWPLVHMRSFEAITGPKPDEFLVRTVAMLLLLVVGILLRQRTAPWERSAVHMAVGTLIVLGLVDITSAAGGWIWKVYYADGAMHLLFATAWLLQLARHQVPFRRG